MCTPYRRPAVFASILATLLSAPFLTGCRHSAELTVSPRDTLIYVMAGQSNMAGRGAVEPQDTVQYSRILSLEADGSFAVKSEPNRLNQGPLAGLDCGKSFGMQLLNQLPSTSYVCLVQCAIGNSLIGEWLGDSVRVVPLYSNLVERSKSAMRSGKLKGVLWLQGESDADNLLTARQYGEHLQTFIERYRRDIGDPRLPFYVGKIPSWSTEPFGDLINSAIEATAYSVPNVFVIPTDDLSCKSDSVHYDAAGQRAIGRRFAEMAAKQL